MEPTKIIGILLLGTFAVVVFKMSIDVHGLEKTVKATLFSLLMTAAVVFGIYLISLP